MSYERKLAFNLRVRGMAESEIAEVLGDVRAHQAASGTPATAEFGPADQYAKQFPKTNRQTLGKIITSVGVALAVAYLLTAVLLMLLFTIDIRDFVGPITLQPAGILIVVSLLVGFLTDYFRPVQRSRGAY